MYAGVVIALILYFDFLRGCNTPCPTSYTLLQFNEKKRNCDVNADKCDWVKSFNATWLQHDSERFDEYLQFSGTSYVIRKIAPILFYRCRHTYTFEGSKFYMLRDFGLGVKEWTLRLDFGQNEETSIEVCDVIDTGETYSFKAWLDHENKCILMKSTPVDKNKGVVNLHIRSMSDDNNMKMVSTII